MTTPLLVSLEQQLAALKSNVVPITQPKELAVVEAPVTVSLNDLRSMVKELVDVERGTTVELTAKPSKEYTLLEAINLGLTSEEQLWIIKEDVITGIANFIASADGIELTKLFITDYRKYYENKT
jgi:hypothetical protein